MTLIPDPSEEEVPLDTPVFGEDKVIVDKNFLRTLQELAALTAIDRRLPRLHAWEPHPSVSLIDVEIKERLRRLYPIP